MGFYAQRMERARIIDRIARICQGQADSRTLRHEVLAEVARVVPFDAYVWALTDPETSVGSAPLADVPPALLPALPQLIRLKYLTEVNRWTGLGSGAARLSDGGPDRSRQWRELLQAHGVTDVASAVFRDRYGCWGFLDLWRAGNTFRDDELSFLDAIAPEATSALRQSQAATFTDPEPTARRVGPVVLLLTSDLEVVGQTPETAAYLRQLIPPNAGAAPIPANAYNVGAQLLAVEAGVDSNPATARVHLSDGRWLSLRAARLGPGEHIAVAIEEASPTERAGVFVRAFGLSAREAELISQLLTGADTREVAGRMFVSEHTVQDHLKSIFAKTGTRTRRILLSRAMGGV